MVRLDPHGRSPGAVPSTQKESVDGIGEGPLLSTDAAPVASPVEQELPAVAPGGAPKARDNSTLPGLRPAGPSGTGMRSPVADSTAATVQVPPDIATAQRLLASRLESFAREGMAIDSGALVVGGLAVVETDSLTLRDVARLAFDVPPEQISGLHLALLADGSPTLAELLEQDPTGNARIPPETTIFLDRAPAGIALRRIAVEASARVLEHVLLTGDASLERPLTDAERAEIGELREELLAQAQRLEARGDIVRGTDEVARALASMSSAAASGSFAGTRAAFDEAETALERIARLGTPEAAQVVADLRSRLVSQVLESSETMADVEARASEQSGQRNPNSVMRARTWALSVVHRAIEQQWNPEQHAALARVQVALCLEQASTLADSEAAGAPQREVLVRRMELYFTRAHAALDAHAAEPWAAELSAEIDKQRPLARARLWARGGEPTRALENLGPSLGAILNDPGLGRFEMTDRTGARLAGRLAGLPPEQQRAAARTLGFYAEIAAAAGEEDVLRGLASLLGGAAVRSQGVARLELSVQHQLVGAQYDVADGEIDEALEHYAQALQTAERMGDEDTGLHYAYSAMVGQIALLSQQARSGSPSRRRVLVEQRIGALRAKAAELGASRDQQARLLLIQANAFLGANLSEEAVRCTARLRDEYGDLPWVEASVRKFDEEHRQGGVQSFAEVALAELTSESLTEAIVCELGMAAAGAGIGFWVGSVVPGIGNAVGAGTGFLIGGALGLAGLKTRNLVRGWSSMVAAGRSGYNAQSAMENVMNVATLGFDAVQIFAPVKGLNHIGRSGIRVVAGRSEDLAFAAGRLRRHLGSALEEIPEGIGRGELERHARQAVLREFTRASVDFGGKTVAIGGATFLAGAIAGPLAVRLHEIQSSDVSATEKARARREAIEQSAEGLAHMALTFAVLGGAQGVVYRYAMAPGPTTQGLRQALRSYQPDLSARPRLPSAVRRVAGVDAVAPLKAIDVPEAIVDVAASSQRVLITGHSRPIKPDGDTVGSALALAHLLEAKGKDVVVVFDDLMPGEARILDPDYPNGVVRTVADLGDDVQPGSFDTAFVVDVQNIDHAGAVAPLLRGGVSDRVAIIDHHQPTGKPPTHQSLGLPESTTLVDPWVRPDSEANAFLISALTERLGDLDGRALTVRQQRRIAEPVLVGILTDTAYFTRKPSDESLGLFRHLVDSHFGGDVNAVIDRLRYVLPDEASKALFPRRGGTGSEKHHAQGSIITVPAERHAEALSVARRHDPHTTDIDIKNHLLSRLDQLQRAEVAPVGALLHEVDGGIAVSLRSGSGEARKLALAIGGGGHANMAGARLTGMSIDEARTLVRDILDAPRRDAAGNPIPRDADLSAIEWRYATPEEVRPR